MATSDILGIWNDAIGNIGAKTSIASLTEQSAEAAACALRYEGVVEKIVRETDWNATRFTADLTDVTSTITPPDRWTYTYSLPTAFQRLWRMETAGSLLWSWNPPGQAMMGFEMAIALNGSSVPTRYIYSHYDSLTAIYGRYAYDSSNGYYEALFDPSLKEAIAWELAAVIAGPLTADARIMQATRQQAMLSLGDARAAVANESAPNMMGDTESLQVRGLSEWPWGWPLPGGA
jgi:hypothetical protein